MLHALVQYILLSTFASCPLHPLPPVLWSDQWYVYKIDKEHSTNWAICWQFWVTCVAAWKGIHLPDDNNKRQKLWRTEDWSFAGWWYAMDLQHPYAAEG